MPTLVVDTPSGARRVTCDPGATVRDALGDEGLRAPYACAGTGACGLCRVQVRSWPLPAPTELDRLRLPPDELQAGVRLACQLRPEGDLALGLDWSPAAEAWTAIEPGALPPLQVPVRPARAPPALGVAVDLGTAHLRVAVWDLVRGGRLGARRGPNPQALSGLDVLSRLEAARASQRAADELSRSVREAVVAAVTDILAAAPANAAATTTANSGLAASSSDVVVVGNTAMLALLTGRGAEALLAPEGWEVRVDVEPAPAAPWQVAWPWPGASVLVAPPLAGFVGSDLAAAVLATGLLAGPPGSLLLDVGTNTELALWDGRTLHATSVAGGPAFEGSGTLHGVPFGPGAVVRVHRAGAGLRCETWGGEPPRGLCGAGLVDAVAALLETGLVRPSGRFAAGTSGEALLLDPWSPRTGVAPRDVDALQRAKAAVAAGVEVLLARAGLAWDCLQRVCVCGAFGSALDVHSAQRIGLLPPVRAERVELWPEASLAGCERALVSGDGVRPLADIAARAVVRNLAVETSYDERFARHLRLEPIAADGPRASSG